MEKKYPLPPFTLETAKQKVQAAEDGWNSKNSQKIALAYATDTEWRNRNTFLHGRKEVEAFLERKWKTEIDYKLKKHCGPFRTIELRFASNMSLETVLDNGSVPMAMKIGSLTKTVL